MSTRVMFGPRRSRGGRIAIAVAFVVLAGVAAWLNVVFWLTEAAVDPDDPSAVWWARGMGGAFPVLIAYLLLLDLRLAVWLDGDRLVQRYAILRQWIGLRTATFTLKEWTWTYPRRLGLLRFRTVSITAPALVVRTPGRRRITVPLVQHTGHAIVDGRVVVSPLPAEKLDALANAIAAHATAPNRDKVVRYLRNVDRAAVRPTASLEPTL
jgi:hypothetical protein